MATSLTIFVCGTYTDLLDEREGVLDAIRKLQFQHDSMEFFGARPDQAIETCLDEVRRSDALIVIVGHLYGSLVPELGFSFTEAEYNEGFRLGKPCLVYFRDENIPVLPKYMERDAHKITLLKNFKDTLAQRHTVASFRHSYDLAVTVAADLSRIGQKLRSEAQATVGLHINILKQGIGAWNAWRANNPKVMPDFKSADLSGMDLSYADFRQADFSNANLRNTTLIWTNFTAANLNKTDLTRAIIGETIFGKIDLSTTRGLDTVQFAGSAIIGIDTLYHSQGNISENFLRNAGVPESMIEYAHALITSQRPIEYYSCFISYSNKDQSFAERLCADLQSKGVRCWFAPEDIKIDSNIRQGLDPATRVTDKFVLVLSKHSVGSAWVEKEVETAMEQEWRQKRTVLFPIRLDSAVMQVESGWAADVRRSRNISDFTAWKQHDAYQAAFTRLLRDLKAEQR